MADIWNLEMLVETGIFFYLAGSAKIGSLKSLWNEACDMTIEERADKAAELKATGQCNCTQSVLKVFEDVLPVDDETLMKMSAGFAAGMGGMQSTCGALIGAVMVAGILSDGNATAGHSRKMVADFEKNCGATVCKDLKGLDTGKPLCECPECVRNAVMALGRQGAYGRRTEICR